MGWATRQAQCSPWLVSLERERGERRGGRERRERQKERKRENEKREE